MALLRFAPSPTGQLHLGGLRMALYNHLCAKKLGGKWILRVEDTDISRTVPGSVDGIRKALDWAGLEYDFGPGKVGPHAPYFQSERLDLYRSYAVKLLDSGHAYRCFCSIEKLANIREKLARAGSNSSYDKTCLRLTEEEVSRRVRAGEKSVVRLNDSKLLERPPAFDLVFGELKEARNSQATDPILLKTDMFPTYHLASVVDDHEMRVTHVLRGEEWLLSFPLHLDLYACLKLKPPQFAHVPLLRNHDGSKMSKRNGDVQVIDYMRRGWEPAAILNWLALAGWGAKQGCDMTTTTKSLGPKINQEAPDSTKMMMLPEMIEQFDISALTHRSSSLDPAKLEYLNKNHLMRIWSTQEGIQSSAEVIHDKVKATFPQSQYTSVEHIKKVILTLEGRLTNLQDITVDAPYFFEEPDLSSLEARAMLSRITVEQQCLVRNSVADSLAYMPEPWDYLNFTHFLNRLQKQVHLPYKTFMTVLRHSLCGQKDGPGIASVMVVLGRQRTINRLKITLNS